MALFGGSLRMGILEGKKKSLPNDDFNSLIIHRSQSMPGELSLGVYCFVSSPAMMMVVNSIQYA